MITNEVNFIQILTESEFEHLTQMTTKFKPK